MGCATPDRYARLQHAQSEVRREMTLAAQDRAAAARAGRAGRDDELRAARTRGVEQHAALARHAEAKRAAAQEANTKAIAERRALLVARQCAKLTRIEAEDTANKDELDAVWRVKRLRAELTLLRRSEAANVRGQVGVSSSSERDKIARVRHQGTLLIELDQRARAQVRLEHPRA